jgi:hypothetical protein
MLPAMRVHWVIVVIGCGAPQQPITNTTPTPDTVRLAPCGFTEISRLDVAAWQAVSDEPADRSKPRPVGSCLLHAIDPQNQRYVVREGSLDIAQLTRRGTLLLVSGMTVGGFAVGMSSDVVLDRHPPDRFSIGCDRSELGTLCGFVPTGYQTNARFEFLVGGEQLGVLRGIAAYEFFRHKTLRGVQLNSRLD